VGLCFWAVLRPPLPPPPHVQFSFSSHTKLFLSLS
jgi:hypothetical protein